MIFPASSQRARYAQASLSVLNRCVLVHHHLRTAKELDITIPPGLLVAANEVIE